MRIKVLGGKTPEYAVVSHKDVMEAAFEIYKRCLMVVETHPPYQKTPEHEAEEQREMARSCLRAAENFFFAAKQHTEAKVELEEAAKKEP